MQLQIAAGHNVIAALKPDVEIHCIFIADFKLPFDKDHNDSSIHRLYNGSTWKPFPKKNLYLIKCEYACFYDMSNTSLAKFNAKQEILIDAVRINFKDCHISNVFLRNLSKKLVKPPLLFDTRYCDQVDEDVNFSTILAIFPQVTHIAFQKAYSGWLYDLASTGKKFHVVEVFNFDFENIFSFKPEELYDFVTVSFKLWLFEFL
uniref:Uncharacterized protein n=1 Tax=Panagrellus redivivus TaxID=6233 RepID=A0A7E4VNN0_PANRE